MPTITIDFRFVEIEYELWALGEYLDVIERQLPILRDQEHVRTFTKLREQGLEADEPEVDIALQELYELVDHVLPRYFRSPFLITLWAVYESAIIEIADYLRDQQGQSLDMQDIRGSFLDRARKYYDHVLEFPLCTDDQSRQRLEMLMVLRNAIAHGSGRMQATNKKARRKIERWVQSDVGISISDGKLIFSERFLRETYAIVKESLQDLLQRARSAS